VPQVIVSSEWTYSSAAIGREAAPYVCRGARARSWSTEALNGSAGLHFFLPDFVVSMTVVFGCRLAVHFLTYRPVTAERCLLPMMHLHLRRSRCGVRRRPGAPA
jgi:hypothetical protein